MLAMFFQPDGGITTDAPYSEIEAAFHKKDAEALARLGSSKLLISLFGKENAYSNQQSAQALRQFFDTYHPASFKFIFKSKENQEGLFAIASCASKNDNLRITFHFKKTDGAYRIVRMNVEKE